MVNTAQLPAVGAWSQQRYKSEQSIKLFIMGLTYSAGKLGNEKKEIATNKKVVFKTV